MSYFSIFRPSVFLRLTAWPVSIEGALFVRNSFGDGSYYSEVDTGRISSRAVPRERRTSVVHRIFDGPIIDVNPCSLDRFSEKRPKFITKHVSEKDYKRLIDGSLRFGTLVSYKRTEQVKAHRLSDDTESNSFEWFVHESEDCDSFFMDGVLFSDVTFGAGVAATSIEHVVNDHCGCFSKGEFDQLRADLLLSKQGDEKHPLSHFVVFDLSRLKGVLEEILAERGMSMGIYGHSIIYGDKDVESRIGRDYYGKISRDVRLWHHTVFTKPSAFAHEDEYRIVLYRIDAPGGLGRGGTEAIILSDNRIASCIVDHGVFS